MPATLLGTALAIASTVWSSFWSWKLFGDRDLSLALISLVWSPVALSAAAAVVQRGKLVVALRAVAGVFLYLWGLFLFAWMFFVGGALMLAAALLAARTPEDLRLTESGVAPAPKRSG